MRVCLCTISYKGKLLEVALSTAAKLGFEAVELWGREPHVGEIYDESRVRGIRTMAADKGLALPVFGSYLRLGATQQREDDITLADTLHTAHGLKTPIVRIWVSDVGTAQATEAIWEQAISEVQTACDRAVKMGVTFAAEMHGGTLADTAAGAKRLVESVDRPNFRLNYQADLAYDADSLQRLETVLPWVVHFHCQNFVTETEGGNVRYRRVQIAEGEIDYRPLFARLKDVGYEGRIAIEFAAVEHEGKEASLQQDLQYLAAL